MPVMTFCRLTEILYTRWFYYGVDAGFDLAYALPRSPKHVLKSLLAGGAAEFVVILNVSNI